MPCKHLRLAGSSLSDAERPYNRLIASPCSIRIIPRLEQTASISSHSQKSLIPFIPNRRNLAIYLTSQLASLAILLKYQRPTRTGCVAIDRTSRHQHHHASSYCHGRPGPNPAVLLPKAAYGSFRVCLDNVDWNNFTLTNAVQHLSEVEFQPSVGDMGSPDHEVQEIESGSL